jgi:hypothetical protein
MTTHVSHSQYWPSAVLTMLALGASWGCVDTTPPWEKVKATGGAGGLSSAGGAGGQALDGPAAAGGSLDTGAGGAIDTGTTTIDGASGGAGGAVDAPSAGAGGGVDAGPGGAGGGVGSGGSPIEVPLAGTGGAVTGGIDGGLDAPLGGSTGTGGTTGTGGRGGATGTGGTTRTGGATGRGGATGTGGATATGGATGTGGATSPDAAPDIAPDLPSDPADTSTLGTGLVAYYTCESATGATGTTLPDMSGNGNHGTLVNGSPPDGGTASTGTGYSFTSGKVGSALTLQKAGYGYVSLPATIFASATDITIAAWVKVVTAQSWPRILDVGVNANLLVNPNTGTKYLNLVPQTSTNNLIFAITNNGYTSEQQLKTTRLSANVWKHLAVVLNAGTGTLYIDGGTTIVNKLISLRPVDLGTIDYAYIGKSQFDADPYFDGAIDEFRVYNRALSPAEVQALYQFAGP